MKCGKKCYRRSRRSEVSFLLEVEGQEECCRKDGGLVTCDDDLALKGFRWRALRPIPPAAILRRSPDQSGSRRCGGVSDQCGRDAASLFDGRRFQV